MTNFHYDIAKASKIASWQQSGNPAIHYLLKFTPASSNTPLGPEEATIRLGSAATSTTAPLKDNNVSIFECLVSTIISKIEAPSDMSAKEAALEIARRSRRGVGNTLIIHPDDLYVSDGNEFEVLVSESVPEGTRLVGFANQQQVRPVNKYDFGISFSLNGDDVVIAHLDLNNYFILAKT